MTAINEIDYDYLADLAKNNRVPFHKLCQRAEKGLPLLGVVQKDLDEWVGYAMAAKLLCSRLPTVHSAFTTNNGMEIEYWGVEWKSRSLIKPKGKRGCGVFFKRQDILAINNIRLGAHVSLICACKVFQAQKQGRI